MTGSEYGWMFLRGLLFGLVLGVFAALLGAPGWLALIFGYVVYAVEVYAPIPR